MMQKYAFRMQLKPGMAAEYERRHAAIWPELVALLKDAGISDYSIHLDPATGTLFSVLWRTVPHGMDDLPKADIMRKWWTWMADLMETNPDQSPVAVPLQQVFHML
jgi:L-rhamnose mutarotase